MTNTTMYSSVQPSGTGSPCTSGESDEAVFIMDDFWLDDFEILEYGECSFPLCDETINHATKKLYGGPTLCEYHFRKWCCECPDDSFDMYVARKGAPV